MIYMQQLVFMSLLQSPPLPPHPSQYFKSTWLRILTKWSLPVPSQMDSSTNTEHVKRRLKTFHLKPVSHDENSKKREKRQRGRWHNWPPTGASAITRLQVNNRLVHAHIHMHNAPASSKWISCSRWLSTTRADTNEAGNREAAPHTMIYLPTFQWVRKITIAVESWRIYHIE